MKRPDLNYRKLLLTMIGGFGTLAAIYATYVLWGAVDAIVYWLAFTIGLTIFPLSIEIFRQSVPNVIGKLHLIGMQVAFDYGYLVEFADRYDWYPGTKTEVWIDGEWYNVQGQDKLDILGWRPFGLVRYKDDMTWLDKRVDTKATADGGVSQASPAIDEVSPEDLYDTGTLTGTDGWWILDLKQLYGRGEKKMGDTELYETTEEVVESEQVKSNQPGRIGALGQMISGAILGGFLAFVVMLL